MSTSSSLEGKRKALLERMRISRAVYRSKLIPEAAGLQLSRPGASAFPRSWTFRLLMHHPYFSATMALVILALGRGSLMKGGVAVGTSMLNRKMRIFMITQCLPAIIQLLQSHRNGKKDMGKLLLPRVGPER